MNSGRRLPQLLSVAVVVLRQTVEQIGKSPRLGSTKSTHDFKFLEFLDSRIFETKVVVDSLLPGEKHVLSVSPKQHEAAEPAR